MPPPGRSSAVLHPNRLLPLTLAAIGLVASIVAVGLLSLAPPARALPPAGTDTLGAVGEVNISSRGGQETVSVVGTLTIQRQDPHMEGGVEVVDAEIISMSLGGQSLVGPVTVTESATLSSTGEVRSLQAPPDQFPASSFFDVFVDVSVPASPAGPLQLHNNAALRVVASADLSAWPPLGLKYELEPVFGFDNDGDGQIDEDTADEDGDGLIDEDRPGPDPDTPGAGFECQPDPDCDGEEGEDPPADLCPPASQGTPTQCDPDADGQIDEDPECIPLLNSANTHLKAGVCVRSVSIVLADPATITPVVTPNGTPSRTPTPTPTLTSTPTPRAPIGDANCSGRIDAIDAALILQFSAELLDSLRCSGQADVNGDGRIDAIDAALILQFVAGLLNTWPP